MRVSATRPTEPVAALVLILLGVVPAGPRLQGREKRRMKSQAILVVSMVIALQQYG